VVNTAQALYEFWSGFGIPAYTIDTVPDEDENGDPVVPPYITYSLVETEPLESATHYAQVWYTSTSNAELSRKVDEIKEAIGDGVRIDCDGGVVVIRPSTPFAQVNVDQDQVNRYAYLNLQLNCHHK